MGLRPGLAGVCATLVLALVPASPAAAQVPPGSSLGLLETDPATTEFTFQDEFTIPADFFGPGSRPLTGRVSFGGKPLQTFLGRDVGDTDTVVRLSAPPGGGAPFPSTRQVPIEIVALSLQGMGPITVRVGNGTQLWDVSGNLSPTRPSRGEMIVTQQSAQGGTLQYRMEMVPQFRFRRLSDGVQRMLDVGQILAQQPQSIQKLTVRAVDVPWRAGCVAPALSVRSVNSGFCPSFTPGRRKVRTIGQSVVLFHGIRPAQPRTEHFKCYSAEQLGPRGKNRSVRLVDQFGRQSASAAFRAAQLCNPVQKNSERLVNRQAHLQCHPISLGSPPLLLRPARVRNQFGSEVLVARRQRLLCVPSSKGRPGRPLPNLTAVPDHFKCYTTESREPFRARTVTLRDQFEARRARVIRPVLLCNPVQKDGARIQHPVHHLVCYEIRDLVRRVVPVRLVATLNQFGRAQLRTGAPATLCVPSLKVGT